MYPEATKARARALRREGMSYRRIAAEVGATHASVETWCAGILDRAYYIRTCWCGERFSARRPNAVSCCQEHTEKRWAVFGPLPPREAA